MIKSFSHNKQKDLARSLIAAGLIIKAYIQTKFIQLPKLSSIFVEDSKGDMLSVIDDSTPIVCYFRDLGPSKFDRIETEGCLPNEYLLTTPVRLVIFTDKEALQSNFAERVISCLGGLTIQQVSTNHYDILNTELGTKASDKTFKDGLTSALMIDFIIKEHHLWKSGCPPAAGLCEINDFIINSAN